MTTLSSKGIVHPGSEVEVQKFVPPLQIGTSLKKENEDGRSGEASRRTGDESPGNWGPASREDTAFREVTRMVEGAKQEARQLMMKSNAMAEEILSEAWRKADQAKEEAAREGYQSGYEDGFKTGMEQAAKEHGQAMEKQLEQFRLDMEKALSSVDEAKEQCIRTYLEELKDCSVSVAEKVIHISLKSSGEVIKRMIIAETEKLKKTAWVKIYMERDDYEMMLEADADVIGELSRLSDNIKFIVMDKENRGNCIIEMPEQIVDISVDTQLENIKEILQNIRI